MKYVYPDKLDKDDFLKLHSTYVQEMHHYQNRHQVKANFFVTLNTALLVAFVAGIIQIDGNGEKIWLLFVPSLVIILSIFGIKVTHDAHEKYLKVVSSRIKIEQILCLTSEPTNPLSGIDIYWGNEPIVYPGHIKSRHESRDSSIKWVQNNVGKRYQKYIRNLFYVFIVFSVAGVVILLGSLI